MKKRLQAVVGYATDEAGVADVADEADVADVSAPDYLRSVDSVSLWRR